MTAAHLDNYPEVLEDLWAKISAALSGKGIAPEVAHEAAFAVTEYIRREWSGRNHYTPKGRPKAAPTEPPQDGLFDNAPAAAPAQAQPEHLWQLAVASAAILAGQGLTELDAERLARTVAELVRSEWAGERIYVAKGVAYDLSRRDYSIWREWDGSYPSKLRLMQQHRITEQRFYQIVAAVRRREFKRTQPQLPFGSGD